MSPDREELRSKAEIVAAGRALLGIELGSTRIKAALVAPDGSPLASGSHAWENHHHDGIWTYALEEVWQGVAACYASLAADVRARYGVELSRVGAVGVSGMMHGYLALDAEGQLLVPFRTWRNNITGQACAELSMMEIISRGIGEILNGQIAAGAPGSADLRQLGGLPRP